MDSSESVLDAHQKDVLRKALVDAARRLLGIPYRLGAEWENLSALPAELDCSELVEGVYVLNGLKMPDGSQNQFDFTKPTGSPENGDLGFFGRGAKPTQIYHVGMVFNIHQVDANLIVGNMIEARGYQQGASFETGKVILRPIQKWVTYKDFVGFRTHPKFA